MNPVPTAIENLDFLPFCHIFYVTVFKNLYCTLQFEIHWRWAKTSFTLFFKGIPGIISKMFVFILHFNWTNRVKPIHMISMCILFLQDVHGQKTKSLAIDLISKIGCAISIAALVITIITYLAIR